jgi:uncharacterized membrane protein
MTTNETPPPETGANPEGDTPPVSLRPRWRFFNLRTSFLTGLVVAAPIFLTVYITVAFVNFVDGWVESLLPPAYNPENYLPFSIPGLGVLLVFLFLVLLGTLTANIAGRWLLSMGERIVNRMPVVRNIYNASKQIFETVFSATSQNFREVCLIEYPRRGAWAIGFVSSETKGEIQARAAEDMMSVFLPTTPNPTSGFLLFVPRKDIIILNMTIEEGAKMVISGGLVAPPFDESMLRAEDGIPVRPTPGDLPAKT